jgi:hypothetical protein
MVNATSRNAEYLSNLQTVHRLARRSAVAVEPRHEILQLHFVFRFRLKDLDANSAGSRPSRHCRLSLLVRGDRFEEGRRFDLDHVAAAFDVGESDAAVAFAHDGARLAYSLFVPHDISSRLLGFDDHQKNEVESMLSANALNGEKQQRNEYIDPKGYWIDPARNIRRLGKQDGEQLVILRATPECSDAEWDRLYSAIVACVDMMKD